MELPTGTVTFVFTDIEGSTRLARQLRGAWGSVLAQHQAVVREAFRSHGGHEVDTQGDSFFYAFTSAREAILAAGAAQRALEEADWPEGGRLRVRMGVHTGQASPTNGRYVGVAVHRAARICGAAHGGQVLVSDTTRELLEDEEVDFRDLGERRLKDVDRPVHLHQLVTPGLQAKFPPPRTERQRSRVPLLVVAGVVVAAAAALVVLFTGSSAAPVAVLPNSVAVIDPDTNDVVAAIPVGESPGPIAAGEEAVWVFNRNARTISKIDSASRELETTFAAATEFTYGHMLAVGHGSVWAGDPAALHTFFLRGTPDETLRIADDPDDFVPGSEWTGMALGPDAMWLVNAAPRLARIDPGKVGRSSAGTRSGAALERVVELQPRPEEFFAGSVVTVAGRVVWIAHFELGGIGTVFRYDPVTGRTSRIDVGGRPAGIAVGEGAAWVTDLHANEVIKINAETAAVDTRIAVGREPSGIAVGGGAVWVVNSGDGTVSRIDPATDEVVATIDVGHRPESVVVAEGAVWVSVREA